MRCHNVWVGGGKRALIAAAIFVCLPLYAQAQISSSSWGQGAIRTGDSTTTCDAAAEGAIRYNNTSNVLEFCDATTWTELAVGGACDSAPAFFAFTE